MSNFGNMCMDAPQSPCRQRRLCISVRKLIRQCASTETELYIVSRKHSSVRMVLQHWAVMSPQQWCQNQRAELIHTCQRVQPLQGTRVCVSSTCTPLCAPHRAVSQWRADRGLFVNRGNGSWIIPCRPALIGWDRIVGWRPVAERAEDFPDPH